MGNNTKTPVDINGKPYYYEDLTQEQQLIIQHIADLDRKLGSARFNVDQLAVGREAFVQKLNESMEKGEDSVESGIAVDSV